MSRSCIEVLKEKQLVQADTKIARLVPSRICLSLCSKSSQGGRLESGVDGANSRSPAMRLCQHLNARVILGVCGSNHILIGVPLRVLVPSWILTHVAWQRIRGT